MERTRVSSSNIASIGYDDESSILEVQFCNGSIYQYFNVSPERYSRLMGAGSHGSYFDSYIKNGGYRYRKVR